MKESNEKPRTVPKIGSTVTHQSLVEVDVEPDSKRPEATVERQFGPNKLTTSLTERSVVSPLGAHERDGDSKRGS